MESEKEKKNLMVFLRQKSSSRHASYEKMGWDSGGDAAVDRGVDFFG